jgi:hypothetical protein
VLVLREVVSFVLAIQLFSPSGSLSVIYICFLCSEVRQYPVAADSTLPTKKRKFDEMEESPKKVLIEEIVDESK